jgi:hypothetical protein
MPVLGGGCQPVGVAGCAEGLAPDGEGGCAAILPPGPEPCLPGTLEVIGHETCQPVGVIACAEGFAPDGEGGCAAILPPGPEPCPPGTLEVIGHETCQPLGDCGTGTWGDVPLDATTVFVSASADATGADGSETAPPREPGER